jgi:hypothetical protein
MICRSRSDGDFKKLQKYFDRGFQDPKTVPGPEFRIPGEDFAV